MRTLLSTVLLFILGVFPSLAQIGSPQDTVAAVQLSPATAPVHWTERRIIATSLSVVIPGVGQSYLGHDEKGAAFTISFFAAGLTTILAENNVVGRNERLDELKLQYAESRQWTDSDNIWVRMKETKRIVDDEAKTRDLFVKITAVIWVVNIVDILLFTDEKPEQTFGALPIPGASLAIAPHWQKGFQASLTVRF